ncbi:putative amidohydrolase [Desulfitispora alkaliphila]|uniref:nitrilase-related carbon-nitrogen hydrolase n=1 Tax=Desulfitispora alkaliphila TaxID=622674 RepID=UPI003D1F75B6
MEPSRIAMVQMTARVGAAEENLAKVKKYVEEAKRKNVDIICFPELAVNGYNRERAAETAEHIPGKSSQYAIELARQSNIVILLGLAEKSANEKPYITHLAAFPDGTIQKHKKTHLGLSEQKYFSPGDEINVFYNEKVNFGIQICWETHFPEVSTILSLNDCEVIFSPFASPVSGAERREIWMKFLAARAYDNSVYVAACNLVGYDGEQEFGGGSLIIDPKGNVINENFNKKEQMIIADLEPDIINKIRTQRKKSMRNSFYLACRRPELYQDLWKGVSTCQLERK